MKGWVYIAALADADGVVKIGYSSKDPSLLVNERPEATDTPRKATVVYAALVENPCKVEAATRKELKSFNTNGKWFRVHRVRAMDTIKAHCQPLFEEGSLIDSTTFVQKDQAVAELTKDRQAKNKIKRGSEEAKKKLLGMALAITGVKETAQARTPKEANKLTRVRSIQSPMIGNIAQINWAWQKEFVRRLELETELAGASTLFESQLKQHTRSLKQENATLKTELADQKRIEKDLTKKYKALDFKAHHDPLTGLPNRRRLMEYLSSAVAKVKANKETLALCFLDLDDFKSINDKWGHAAGDLVLFEISRRLRELNTLNAVIGRLAGDEFLIIVEKVQSKKQIAQFAQHVAHRIKAPIEVCGETIQTSGSLGISFCPESATDVRSLLTLADEAMYQAKVDEDSHYRIFQSGQLPDEHFLPQPTLVPT
jgi:diguanylate cyclase (GGDEF)-like protein